MDFKQKYLKYKNKYIDLKKLIGGAPFSTQIFLVEKFVRSLTISLEESLYYENTLLQNIEDNNLKELDEKAEYLYNMAKNQNIYDVSVAMAFYDAIASFYMCTKEINELWNDVAYRIKSNIRIFIGDNTAMKDIFYSKDENSDNFIVGINILLSCMTHDHAINLNKKYNGENKYFVGFKYYVHPYGTSVYNCMHPSGITQEDFITEYDNMSADVYPINKIITIFFNNLKNKLLKKGRECYNFTLDNIEKKLLLIKTQITLNNKPSSKGELESISYFNKNSGTICDLHTCSLDLKFENYISDNLKRIYDREAEVKADVEKSKIKKRKITMDKLQLLENPDIEADSCVTDITQTYSNYISIDQLKKKFNWSMSTTALGDINPPVNLFLIKKKGVKQKYFKLMEIDHTKNCSYFTYIQIQGRNELDIVNVDKNGKIYNDDDKFDFSSDNDSDNDSDDSCDDSMTECPS